MCKLSLSWGCFMVFYSSAYAAEYSPAEFHRNVYLLHQQQIAQHAVRTEQEKGDYAGAAAAGYSYLDIRYYDAANGHLLSHVRRDASKPELIHIVEVNIYQNDKLVRDFGSVSLPWMPLRPVRTFINLHQYNEQLHSFRQYDITGQIGYEFCEGSWKGEPVKISLDDADINASNSSSEVYQNCFKDLNPNWAQYKIPH